MLSSNQTLSITFSDSSSLKPISHYWKRSQDIFFVNKLTYEENIFAYITHSIIVTGWKIKFEWRVTFNAIQGAWNEKFFEYVFVMTYIIIENFTQRLLWWWWKAFEGFAPFCSWILRKSIHNFVVWMNLRWILCAGCL